MVSFVPVVSLLYQLSAVSTLDRSRRIDNMVGMFHGVQVNIDLPKGTTLQGADGPELAKGMEAEIDSFEKWFEGQGNAPLVNVERAIVRTYLAWKLRYEEAPTEE